MGDRNILKQVFSQIRICGPFFLNTLDKTYLKITASFFLIEFSPKSILPKRGSAFYNIGTIPGFSHGRYLLLFLILWYFAHGYMGI